MKGPLKFIIAEMKNHNESNSIMVLTGDASLLKEKSVSIARNGGLQKFSIVSSRLELSPGGVQATLFVKPEKRPLVTRLLVWLSKKNDRGDIIFSTILFVVLYVPLLTLIFLIFKNPYETLGLMARYSGWCIFSVVLIFFYWLGARQKFSVIGDALQLGSWTIGATVGYAAFQLWGIAFNIDFDAMSNQQIGTALLTGRPQLLTTLSPYVPAAAIVLKWLGWPLTAELLKDQIKVLPAKAESGQA